MLILASPVSASTTQTRAPCRASATARLTLILVLPTPPLPLVTATMRVGAGEIIPPGTGCFFTLDIDINFQGHGLWLQGWLWFRTGVFNPSKEIISGQPNRLSSISICSQWLYHSSCPTKDEQLIIFDKKHL